MHSGKTPDAGCTPDSCISTNSIGQSLAASVLDASWTDTMAFSFGSTTTTPSPAVGSSTGSFSFGGFGSAGTNAAPSSTTGFSFGGAAPGTTAGEVYSGHRPQRVIPYLDKRHPVTLEGAVLPMLLLRRVVACSDRRHRHRWGSTTTNLTRNCHPGYFRKNALRGSASTISYCH